MAIKGSRVLVTGGAGFIGSHLVCRLIELEAAEIIVLDNLSKDKTSSLPRDPKVQSSYGEISRFMPWELQALMRDVDYVFHMAVLPLNPCAEHPRLCIETNIMGTLAVVEAACSAKVKKLIFSSASAVYGDSNLTVEESHPLNANTLYGASKMFGEMLVRNLCAKSGMGYVILRYMNVYGPGIGGLIGAVLDCLKKGVPPTINGDGSQSFDFVHVQDVVNANILAAESEVTGETFNIGGGEEVSANRVVELLLEQTVSRLKPVYAVSSQMPPARRVGSSAKAKQYLGYVPKIKFEDGIKEIVG